MKVRRYDGESIESLLRRFKKATGAEMRADINRHAFALTKSERRRQKRTLARRRLEKKIAIASGAR